MFITYHYFLGLKNLDILTNAVRRIYVNHNIRIDLENLPEDKAVFREIFAKGNTNCVFQFESEGMKQMLRDFKPDCFEDIILLVAAYRPGPMESIPKLIDVKQKGEKPYYIIPELESILSPTYGQVIYQEQLMDIFHHCAGFSLSEADIIRRYMSKKKKDKFLAYKDKFIDGLINHNASKNEAEEFWNSLVHFAEYAFNRSHAAAYALIAYQTAYIKYYYPVEYMCAVMTIVANTKLASLCYECNIMGITIKGVDINYSANHFLDYPEQKEIRFGFRGIKGIGTAGTVIEEERKKGPFLSVVDFMKRVHPKKDVMEALVLSGAFDCFYKFKRKALYDIVPELSEKISSILKKNKKLEEKRELIKEETDSKKRKTLQKSMDNLEKSLVVLEDELNSYHLKDEREDDEIEMLSKEKEYLSAYISQHPLDSYKDIYTKNIMLSSAFRPGDAQIAGIISNIQWLKRKKDNADFLIFQLDDLAGSIKVIVSVNKIEEFRPLVKEGNVVKIKCSAIENEEDSDEKTVFGNKIFKCKQTTLSTYLIELKEEQTFFEKDIQEFLASYKEDDGHPVLLFNKRTGKMNDPFTVKAKVSKDILNAIPPSPDIRIIKM